MASRFQVVIADYITGELAPEQGVLSDIAEVTALNAFSEAELAGKIETAHAVMLYHNVGLSRISITRLAACKAIVRCGVGIDNVDLAFARERNIPVMNVPDYGTEDVADSAIGMLLALTRGIHYQNSLLRNANHGRPWDYTNAAPLRRLRGRVFAIVGLGSIGSAAALRAKALGMEVAFYDPYLPDGMQKALGVRRVETLPELLKQAYVLSLHCPLTPETRHMINGESLKLLPRGAYLVNTARGAVVDTAAVAEFLAAGHLAGAGIDVLEGEPPRENDVLVQAWRDPAHAAYHRVILNPHCAFYTEEGLIEMRVKGSQACRRALLGERLRNVVNGVVHPT